MITYFIFYKKMLVIHTEPQRVTKLNTSEHFGSGPHLIFLAMRSCCLLRDEKMSIQLKDNDLGYKANMQTQMN